PRRRWRRCRNRSSIRSWQRGGRTSRGTLLQELGMLGLDLAHDAVELDEVLRGLHRSGDELLLGEVVGGLLQRRPREVVDQRAVVEPLEGELDDAGLDLEELGLDAGRLL